MNPMLQDYPTSYDADTIASEHYFTAAQGVRGAIAQAAVNYWGVPDQLQHITFCVLVLRSGTVVTGCSHSAPGNGIAAKAVAREAALRQVRVLMLPQAARVQSLR